MTPRRELITAGRLLASERKRHGDELSATLSLLETAQEVGEVGTFVAWLTPDKVGVDEWSKTCMEIFGYDEATYDNTNEAFWRRVHPDDREMVREAQRLAVDGYSYDVKHRIIRPDGEVRWIRERAKVERDGEGTPVRFLGVTMDITEERNAEEALRASEARFRGVFDSSGIGTAIMVGGTWVQVNEALCTMLGRSQSELVGHSYLEFALEEDVESVQEAIKRMLSTGKGHHTFEHRMRRADGSTIWARAHLSPVRGADGDVTPMIAQIEDITDAKDAAEARAESVAKSRFLAGLSHEIRNPLNTVLGFAELLERTGLGTFTDKQARFIRNIRASGELLLDLVNDVLDFSKIQAGQMTANLQPLAVGEAVESVIERMAPIADAKGVRLVAEGCRGGELAIADRRRLTQVLLNLVANAIKFTPSQGSVTLRCSTLADGVQVAVTDTGIGIAPEHQEGIFQEFVQVDNDETRNQTGTGLGLALSKGLIALMGGSIGVASLPGKGSTFTITLRPAPAERLPRTATASSDLRNSFSKP